MRLGLVLHREFHEQGRWVSALTPRLIDELCRRHEVCWIGDQRTYEAVLGDLDALFSCEPGWAAPKLDFSRTPALRAKLAEIPSYITFSDPHDNRWRERYFLRSGLGFVLGYYYEPTLRHFRRLPPERLVHFPWAVPDEWIGREPIVFRGQERIACFGASRHEAYTVRNWCRTFPFVDSRANSGVENKVMTDEEYAAWLATLDAAIAAGSDDPRYQLTTPKYFEIAAAGALLFAQWTPDLARLGFEHGVNCLVFDRGSFEVLAREYLARPEEFLPLREAGRELIRRRHSLSVRLDEWEHHALETREALARARRGATVPVRRPPRTRRRPLVTCIVDEPGWAHDLKARNLARALSGRYQFKILYQRKLRARWLDAADLILVFYWMQLSHLERMGEAFARNRHKLVLGVCSHQEIEGDRRKPALEALGAARAVFANNLALWRELSAELDRPVFYTPNGVDTDFFAPAEAAGSAACGELAVGWAGSLSNFGPDERGFDSCLVPAVERTPGTRLAVAAREERWRDAAEMRDFYRSLDVYVCASRAEGTPNPCLEAAACGVPIVTTRVGNMPEFVEEGVSGLFIDRDPDSLAERLAFLRDAPALRAALGRGARRAAERWDWR
ncbi:MAG: glycosyltransferase, partial [Acidobacteria bacterium]